MIGLGSNRLSVCRRGGMSVTQAGRGGMEWLAGGRRPRWSSPYSAQATAALKDAFTAAQWVTIRDYGFAHPALVPFVNDDPMLVMSLIEGLGTRWLVGDGNSWIVTNMRATSTTWTEVTGDKVVLGGTAHEGFTGNNGDSMSSIGYIAFQKINNVMYVQALTINEYIRGPFDDFGNKHTYKIENNNFYIDGVAFGNIRGSIPNYHADGLMTVFRTMQFNPIKGNVSKAKFWNSNEQLLLVPFVSTTRNGMLDIHDLEHPTFYPNQGTGTFTTSETPAS